MKLNYKWLSKQFSFAVPFLCAHAAVEHGRV